MSPTAWADTPEAIKRPGLPCAPIGTLLAPLLTGALSTQQREVTRAGLSKSIDGAIKEANQVIKQAATIDRQYKGMGATASVVVIWNGRVVVGHVGDCRVYHQRTAHLKLVTRDQLLIDRMVALGQLTPEEAAAHPARNTVLQAIGARTAIEPAHYKLNLLPGDWLLIACDGLHSQVDDRNLEAIVSKAPPSAVLLANRLVDLADESGGVDNCTVVAVRCYQRSKVHGVRNAMSVASPTALLAFLQEHEFLTPSQARQLGGASFTMYADTRALVRELVDRNWLTAYQANRLLQGRGTELLLGPYRILDRLGEGGMGQVFRARHSKMDRLAALKIIPKERVTDPVAVSRFYREVRAVAQLSHPNIVTAFEVNQVGDTHYLAMELVNGIDLAKLVQQSGPLAVAQASEYVRQAAVGMQHAHEKGLVHRDIKPANLMVARPCPDEPPIVKILDLGLARFESESDRSRSLTADGKIFGTVDYIAPEQAENSRTADIRADIYSLGCSLFYLLTGKPPFSGDTALERITARVLGDVPSVRNIRPEVSPALDGIVATMIARKPANRYQKPGEVAKALEAHTDKAGQVRSLAATSANQPIAVTVNPLAAIPALSETIANAALALPSTASKTAKRRKVLGLVLIGGLISLGLGLVFFTFWGFREKPSASNQPSAPAGAVQTPAPGASLPTLGGDTTKYPIKLDLSYLEKTWGLKYKSSGVGNRNNGFEEVVIVLEFTKDVEKLQELQTALDPRFYSNTLLWFYFFDAENVFVCKLHVNAIEGEVTGKKGDAIRVSILNNPNINPDLLKKSRKIEARPEQKK